MTQLKLLLASFFLLLSAQLHAQDTTPKPELKTGLKCVFFSPQVSDQDLVEQSLPNNKKSVNRTLIDRDEELKKKYSAKVWKEFVRRRENLDWHKESPLSPMHDRLPAIAKKAGVSGHSQVMLTLDPDKEKRAAEIKAALSGPRFDLLALPYSRTILGKLPQFIEIMDQAVTTNPKMQFLIQIPSPVNIPTRDANTFKYASSKFHKAVFEVIVKELRKRYPSNRISSAYYGLPATEMKLLFAKKELPGITSLVGEKSVFLTEAGQPGPILADLNAMFTLSLIYDVDLAQTDLKLGYEADLVAIAAKALKHEAKHRPAGLDPWKGDGPNIFTLETWERPWASTLPATKKKGLKCFFYGHEYFTQLADAIGPVAEKAGITDHKATTYITKTHVYASPAWLALAIQADPPRVSEDRQVTNLKLEALLNAGKIDLLGLTYFQRDTGRIEHYKEIFDYVLARNPNAQLLIHFPSAASPALRRLSILNREGDALRAKFYATVVVPLRKAYPDKKIHFWYSGRVSSEMRRRFEDGELPQVYEFIGDRGIFSGRAGYPGPFLQDLQALILYSLIYDVELPKSVPGLKGKIDLNALAAEMIEMEKKKGL